MLFLLRALEMICIIKLNRKLSCFALNSLLIFEPRIFFATMCWNTPAVVWQLQFSVTICDLWIQYSSLCSETCTSSFPSYNMKDATSLLNSGRSTELLLTFHDYSPLATSQTVMDWSSDPVYKYLSSFEKQAQQMPFRRDVGWKWMVKVRLWCW